MNHPDQTEEEQLVTVRGFIAKSYCPECGGLLPIGGSVGTCICPLPEELQTCSLCRFYRKHECHRFPPSIRHTNSPGCGEWPTPAEMAWCGEWSTRR